jgi:hypothetical protein
MMLVAPKMKPMTRPTAVDRVRKKVPTASHAFKIYSLPPIMPPIFTARVLAAKHAYMDLVEARILLSRVDWPPAPPPGTAATGGILVVCVCCMYYYYSVR